MDFTNEFRVSLPAESAWALLTDVERIAPCMPGAKLTGVEGDQFQGTVKVKVGPVTVLYRGVASFEDLDVEQRIAVLKAKGRDTRGQGTADAVITARLEPDGEGTRVAVTTRLSVTGKVAQFGKGVMEDVSKKLLAQFVACLEAESAEERQPRSDGASGELGGTVPTTAPAAITDPLLAPEEPLDLLRVARGPVLKRILPVVAGALVVVGVIVWAKRLGTRAPCRMC